MCIFQVKSVAEDKKEMSIKYLEQPYKAKPGLWRYGKEDLFLVDASDVDQILKHPEHLKHRTGTEYLYFAELE